MLKNYFNYGAANAKVRGVYKKFLKRKDYDTLLSMHTVPEIASYLKEHTHYSDLADKLDIAALHRGDLETALLEESEKNYFNFFRYLSKKDREFVMLYQSKIEINELLRFCRFYNQGAAAEFTPAVPAKLSSFSKVDFDRLETVSDYHSFLEALSGTPYYGVFSAYAPTDGKIDLALISVLLDTEYYRRLLNFHKKSSPLFVKYLTEKIDLINISRAVRLKVNYDMEPEKIKLYLIPFEYKIDINRMLAESKESIVDYIKTTYYGRYAGKGDERLGRIRRKQAAASGRKMLRETPPSIFNLIGYFNLRDLEIHNIICIIEGVRYRLSADKIRAQLIL